MASADNPRPAFLYDGDSHSDDETLKEELRAKLAEQREANKRDYSYKQLRKSKPGPTTATVQPKVKSKKQLALEQRRRQKEMEEIKTQLDEQAKHNEEKEKEKKAVEAERVRNEEDEWRKQREEYARERESNSTGSGTYRRSGQTSSGGQSFNVKTSGAHSMGSSGKMAENGSASASASGTDKDQTDGEEEDISNEDLDDWTEDDEVLPEKSKAQGAARGERQDRQAMSSQKQQYQSGRQSTRLHNDHSHSSSYGYTQYSHQRGTARGRSTQRSQRFKYGSDDSYCHGDQSGYYGHNQLSNQQQFGQDLPPRFRKDRNKKRPETAPRHQDSNTGDWHLDGTWTSTASSKGSGWGTGHGGASDDTLGWGNPPQGSHSGVVRKKRGDGWSSSDHRPSSWTTALDDLQQGDSKDSEVRKSKKKSGIVLPDDLEAEPDWGEPTLKSPELSPKAETWPVEKRESVDSWEVEEESGRWKQKGSSASSSSGWDLNDPRERKKMTVPRPTSTPRHSHPRQQSAPITMAPSSRSHTQSGPGNMSSSRPHPQAQTTSNAVGRTVDPATQKRNAELARQVRQLKEMGFEETRSVQVLLRNNMDFEAALGDLLALAATEGTPPLEHPKISITECPSKNAQTTQPTQARPGGLPITLSTSAAGPSVLVEPNSKAFIPVRQAATSQPPPSFAPPAPMMPVQDRPPPQLQATQLHSEILAPQVVPNWPLNSELAQPGGAAPFISEQLPPVGNNFPSPSAFGSSEPQLSRTGLGQQNQQNAPVPSVGLTSLPPMSSPVAMVSPSTGRPKDTASPQEKLRQYRDMFERMRWEMIFYNKQLQDLSLKEAEMDKSDPSSAQTLSQLQAHRLRIQESRQQTYYRALITQHKMMTLAQHDQPRTQAARILLPTPMSQTLGNRQQVAVPSAPVLAPPAIFGPSIEAPVISNSGAMPATIGSFSSTASVSSSFDALPQIDGPITQHSGVRKPTQTLGSFLESFSDSTPPPTTTWSTSGHGAVMTPSIPLTSTQTMQQSAQPAANFSTAKKSEGMKTATSDSSRKSVWSGSPAEPKAVASAGSHLDKALDVIVRQGWTQRRMDPQTPMSPGVLLQDPLDSKAEPFWPSTSTTSVLDSVPGVIGSKRPGQQPLGVNQPAQDAGIEPALQTIPEHSSKNNEEEIGESGWGGMPPSVKPSGWGELSPAELDSTSWPAGSGWQATKPSKEEAVLANNPLLSKVGEKTESLVKMPETVGPWPWSKWGDTGKGWPLLLPADMSGAGELEQNGEEDPVSSETSEWTGEEEERDYVAQQASLEMSGSPWLLIENIPSEMEEGSLRVLCQNYGTIYNFCFDRSRHAALMRYDNGQISSDAAVDLDQSAQAAGQGLTAKVATDAEIGIWIQESLFSSNRGDEKLYDYGQNVPPTSYSQFGPPQIQQMPGLQQGMLPNSGSPARMPRVPMSTLRMRMSNWGGGGIPGSGQQGAMDYQHSGPMYSMQPAPWNAPHPQMSQSHVWTSRQPRGPNAALRGIGRGFRRSQQPHRSRPEDGPSA